MPDRGCQARGKDLQKVVVWDAEGSPPVGNWTTVLWRGFENGAMPNVVSIPKLIEENSDILRKRYLAWIYEFGAKRFQGRPLVDHMELRPGFSYWWMTLFVEKCNYSKSPQIDNAIRLMAFDDWAADRSVGSITLASANQPLAECMRLWCARMYVPFELQRIHKQTRHLSWARQTYQAIPRTVQALIWLSRYIVDRWSLRGVGLYEWRQSHGRVTFVSYLFNLVTDAAKEGRFESRYWAHLPNELQSKGCKTNWLHLYEKDGLLPDAAKAAVAIREFNKTGQGEQIHATLDTFLTASVVFKTLSDWYRLAWTGRRLQQAISSISSEGLNLWPLFTEDWRKSTCGPEAMRNVLYLNLFESAMQYLPRQRVGVYLQENQDWEFALIHAWQAAGQGRLIGCPHSTVRFWDLRYFFDPRSYSRADNNPMPLPDQIALNGVAATCAYLEGGYPAQDLVQVEALRYLYLDDTRGVAASDSLLPKGDFRLLVLGDYLLSNTQLQMRLLEQAARYLPPGTTITVRPHPNCQVQPLDYPDLRMFVTMEPIFKLLPVCDVAYASAMTSAAVDAYCSGVPVVSVLDPNTLSLSPLRGCAGTFSASTPQELAHALISAASVTRSVEAKQNFFTIDQKLPRWWKLLFGSSTIQ